MKGILTVFIFFLPFSLIAQTNSKTVSTGPDTLTITSPNLPAMIRHNTNIYQLKKITPGVRTFSFDFTEPALSVLLQLIELSNGSHYEVEQVKALIREQLKTQVSPK